MRVTDELIIAMEAVPTPLALMHAIRDDQGTMVDLEWDYVNAAGAREILVPRDELIGQRLLTKLPDHRNGLFDLYVNVVETGEPMIINEAGLEDNWGTEEVIPRIYDIRATRAGDGVFIWWADVTDRVQQSRELRRHADHGTMLDLLINRSPIGMARVTADGVFTEVNPAFGAITGLSVANLEGRSFVEITHPEDVEKDLQYVKQLASREIDSYKMDKRYVRPDGSIVWVRLHASGVWAEDGTFITFIAQVVDIDREKLLIEKLERSNHDLRHFAFVASHDLQAPLRIASTYSELLFAELPPEVITDEHRDSMREITTALAHMRRLVTDLLDYSRATSSEIPQETFNVSDLIADAIDHLQFDLVDSDTEVTVEVTSGLVVQGSRTQLVRAFVNLLANSIKYRNEQQRNHITVHGYPKSRQAHITVTDNGIGIPPALQDKAFTMFQRLHTDSEGTGLGLALVRSTIERHGGTVELTSDGVSGTTVLVRLPMVQANDASPHPG